MLDEILLLTNGPGELSTWVPPVLTRLRQRVPGARIELFLIRDQFAAGTEQTKAEALQLDALSGRSALLRRVLGRRAPGRGLVLLLGGAPRRGLAGPGHGLPGFFLYLRCQGPSPRLAGRAGGLRAHQGGHAGSGVSPARIEVVGNLVVDALHEAPAVPAPATDVLLLAGSRPFAARYLLGFLLAAAEQMAKARPGLRFAWVKSRLLPEAVVAEALSGELVRELGGVGARWVGIACKPPGASGSGAG